MSVVPINVGRPRSVRLVEDLLGRERALVGVVSQRSPDVDEPTFKELYTVGTVYSSLNVGSSTSGERLLTTPTTAR